MNLRSTEVSLKFYRAKEDRLRSSSPLMLNMYALMQHQIDKWYTKFLTVTTE